MYLVEGFLADFKLEVALKVFAAGDFQLYKVLKKLLLYGFKAFI